MDNVDPMLAAVSRFTRAAEDGIAQELQRSINEPISFGPPWTEVKLDLASSALSGAGQRVNVIGHELYYKREGSAPGGRLQIEVNGEIQNIYPGMRLKFKFDGFTVKLNTRSANVGEAFLIIARRENVRYEEPSYDDIPGSPLEPVFLLGSENLGANSVTYQTVNLDEKPTGADWDGSFHTQGFKRIRVLIDNTGVSGTLTSFNVIPWIQYPGQLRDDATIEDQMFEVGSATLEIPDSLSSDEKRRTFIMDIVPGDYVMALEFCNNGGDAEQVKVAIQGIN